MEFKDLIIPTINVNDTKVTISDIRKENLEYIEEGEVLYSVETSKATEEYKADFAASSQDIRCQAPFTITTACTYPAYGAL